MNDDLVKKIDSMQENPVFIKTSDQPISGLSDPQKVALIRKANALFNEGKLEMAERIFVATGYSDGLTRIGDKYAEKNEILKALKFYVLAHNKRKSEPVIEKISKTVSLILKS